MTDYSENECINWMNVSLGLNLKSPDELSGGVPYCQLMALMFPTVINMEMVVIVNTRTEIQSRNNLKILFSAFAKKGLNSNVDFEDLATGDKQAQLKFVRWFYSKFNYRVAVTHFSYYCRKVNKKLESEEKEVAKELLRALREQAKATAVEKQMKAKYAELNKTMERERATIQVCKKLREDATKSVADVVDNVLDFEVDKSECSNAHNNSENREKFNPKTFLNIIGEAKIKALPNHKSSTVHGLASAVENTIKNVCTAVHSIHLLAELKQKSMETIKNTVDIVKLTSTSVQKQVDVVRVMENRYKSKVSNRELANAASQDCQYALSVLDAYDVCRNAASKSTLSVDAVVAVREAKKNLSNIKTYKDS